MNKWLLVALALFATLIGAIAFVPANVVESPVNRALSDVGSFSVKSGTVWSGEGVLSLKTNTRSPLLIPLRWSFDPTSLLRLRIGHSVIATGAEIKGSARIGAGFTTLSIRELALDASIETLMRLGTGQTLLSLSRPSGPLTLTTLDSGVTLGYSAPHLVNGALALSVREFRIRSIFDRPFTTASAEVRFVDSRGEYRVVNSTGLVRVEGGGKLDLSQPAGKRPFAFAGFLISTAELPTSIRVGLMAMGRLSGDGRIRVDSQTQF